MSMTTKEDLLEALRGCKTNDARADAVLALLEREAAEDETQLVFATGHCGAVASEEEIADGVSLYRNGNGTLLEVVAVPRLATHTWSPALDTPPVVA
jgi:hypothetical protein